MVKMGLLAFGVTVALILWAVARLMEQRMEFANTGVLWSALLLVGGYAVSAALSADILRSFIGYGFERDTVMAILVLVAALSAVALIFQKKGHLVWIQHTMLASFLILGLLQVARIVLGADVVFPSIFSTDATANILGSWNDLGIFSGLVVLISIVGFAYLSLKGAVRILWYGAFAVALFLLAMVNLSPVWAALAIISLVFLIYTLSAALYSARTADQQKARLPWGRLAPSAAVFLVSVLFLLAGSAIGERVVGVFDVAHIDVRPSWEGTIQVGSAAYEDRMLFGNGPNTFVYTWAQHKPMGVNGTNFWNVDFTYGIGLIPTTFISGGLVVGLLWLLFLGSFVYLGFRILTKAIANNALSYLTMSTFIGATYLWVLAIVYVPQITMLTYAFIFTGACVAALRLAGIVRTREVDASRGLAPNFLLMSTLVTVVVVAAAIVVVEADRVMASSALTRSVAMANTGDFNEAHRILSNAGFIGKDGRVGQVRANIGVAELGNLLADLQRTDSNELRSAIQSRLSETIRAAQEAIENDPLNYRNRLLLADIYAQLAPLGIEGARASAVDMYAQAAKLNPTTPLVPLRLAQLALAGNDMGNARTHLRDALELKANYTSAHFLLSQIEIREGNTRGAIASTEAAALLAPNNPGLLFQLGVLYYSEEEYQNAVAALEAAIALQPDYANALYFLGLSYDRLGNREGALAAFTRVAELNPDNTEVANIVAALQIEGGSAFDVLVDEEDEAVPEELPVPETR
jgi:tetratricopeptide (TPR) repeat protein